MEIATNPAEPTRVKPRLRGLSHEIAFYFAVAACIALVIAAPAGLPTTAALVYGLSVATLFGTSALYHRPTGSPGVRIWLRRADHSAIFLLIAGSYTPMCLVALPPEAGHRLLALVWGGAGIGILRALFWPNAPRWLTASTYILLGWAVVVEWHTLGDTLGMARVALIGVGGLMYSGGAVVYARKSPDPVPEVFGYHEIFHALVVAAALCHYAALGNLVLWGPASP